MAKLNTGGGNFIPCPNYDGPAVCVDVTPLQVRETQFGPKEEFRFAFEVELKQENGEPFCVWSRGMTTSYDEKANLHKFLKGWMGRVMTKEELANFDTEQMLGASAHVVIEQEHKDDKTYANIVLIRPAKKELAPSGKFVRKQDREARGDGGQRPAPAAAGAARPAGASSGYKPAAPAPAALAGEENLTCKVHVGKCVGLQVRDLSPEQLDKLVLNWLPVAHANPKTTADDRRLMAALDWYVADKAKSAAPAETPADDLPY
jgi:hypothetical protein